MKKVLFLSNTFPNDEKLSSGVFNYNAAQQLSQQCELTVIHLRSWRPFRKVVENKKINNLKFICFSFPYYPINNTFVDGLQLFFYQFFIRLFLRKKIKKNDVIHSVGAAFSGVIGSYLSKHLNKPHIAQCIGTDVNITMPSKKDGFFYSVMDKYVDIYTTNSRALENQVLNLYPNSKTKTIYRGVDLEFFNSAYHKKTHSKIIFTYIGGLTNREEHHSGRDYKGGITLLKAWQSLNDYTNIELHFMGPAVNKELVKEILQQDPSELNIKGFKYLNRIELKDLFAHSDVVIIPSWLEGLPNAGMEALASSCAILGSNVGGIPELINNNGYLFYPGDTKELTKFLHMIVSNKNQLAELKFNSRSIAEKKFNSKQFSELYCELYETL